MVQPHHTSPLPQALHLSKTDVKNKPTASRSVQRRHHTGAFLSLVASDSDAPAASRKSKQRGAGKDCTSYCPGPGMRLDSRRRTSTSLCPATTKSPDQSLQDSDCRMKKGEIDGQVLHLCPTKCTAVC
eukprot:3935920-Rhodomonas_salina.1